MPSFARASQFAELAPGRRPLSAAVRTLACKQAQLGHTSCACGGSCPQCSGSSANGTTMDRGWQTDGIPAIACFDDAGDIIAIDAPDGAPTTSPTVPSSPPLPAAPTR